MKKYLLMCLVGVLCLTLLLGSGCSQPAAAPETKQEEAQQEKAPVAEKEKPESTYPRTVTDNKGREVTVQHKPERIVGAFISTIESMRNLNVPTESIVSVTNELDFVYFPELSGVTEFVGGWEPDAEHILTLEPDLVILHTLSGMRGSTGQDDAQEALEALGVPVLRMNFNQADMYADNLRKLAHLLDREQEAEEYLSWLDERLAFIENRVKDISEEDKPKVWFMFTMTKDSKEFNINGMYSYIQETGGRDIFADLPGDTLVVETESIIERDPDVIIRIARVVPETGDGFTDPQPLKELRDDLMNMRELQNVSAVKEGRVYVITPHMLSFMPNSGCRYFMQHFYQAKWFHPELFQDLDPKDVHQEYLSRFQGLEVNVEDFGVYVYHPEEHPGGY